MAVEKEPEVNVGKEPGNWELYRGIERVEKTLHDMATAYVPSAVYAAEKTALESKIAVLDKQDAERKAENLALEKKIDDYSKEQEAQKGRNRLFVYGIVAAPVIAIAVGWVANGGFMVLP